MRVCIVYDCLYPYTIGGAERWYRNLAERLAASGHEVTFLTRRQWERGERARRSRRARRRRSHRGWSSTRTARRRILPPLALRPRRPAAPAAPRARYDVVHTASFPYFSLLAAAAVAPARRASGCSSTGTRSGRASTGASISGRVGGWIGWRDPASVPARAAARVLLLAAARAAAARGGLRRRADAPRGAVRRARRAPTVAPPRRRSSCSRAATSRRSACRRSCRLSRERASRFPTCAARSTATGPSAPQVLRAIAECGLDGRRRRRRGSSTQRCSRRRWPRALCLVLPSRREGYGLVVIEAAARGVPASSSRDRTTPRSSSSRRE